MDVSILGTFELIRNPRIRSGLRYWYEWKLQNLILAVALSQLIQFADGSDIQISCLFTGSSNTFRQDSIAHLCCNYSILARYSPSVFIDGTLQGVSIVDEPGCRIVYVLQLFSNQNGLEIAVAYGTNSVGRWNATLHVESINLEYVTSSASYSYWTPLCSSTDSYALETVFPRSHDVNHSHSSPPGQPEIWLAITGVGVAAIVIITCTAVIAVFAVVKRRCLKQPVAGFSSEESKTGQTLNRHTLSRSTSFHESDHALSIPNIPREAEEQYAVSEASSHHEMNDEDIQLQHNPAYEPVQLFPVMLCSDQHNRVVAHYSPQVAEMQPNPAYVPLPLTAAMDNLEDNSH